MIGRTIKGKYRVYDTVGTGGFATVYLGRNTDTNEIVAVKVLSAQYTRDEQYLERFRREAAMAERLRHRNVVRVLDHGIEDGQHFLVMEFVEGLTLEHLLERTGPLSIEQTVSFTEQVCAGLEAAHRAGVVHRDIKPSNLMITPAGTVKIMDFGIARVQALGGLTQSGMFMGTPRYLSPETARGERVDIRSDLYSVGLLMYEMLTGSPPFDGENPWAILRQQVEAEPPPLSQARPGVPGWLEAIMMRALAKDPARRFQTPAEMLSALQTRSVLGGATPAQPRVRPSTQPTVQIDTPLMPGGTAATAVPQSSIPSVREPTPVPRAGKRDATPGAPSEKPRARVLLLALSAVVVLAAVAIGVLYALGFLGGGPSLFDVAETVVVVIGADGSATLESTSPEITVVITSTPEDTATVAVVVPPTNTSTPQPSPTEPPTSTRAPSPEPTATHTPTRVSTATHAPTPTTPPTQPPTAEPTQVPTQAPTRTPKPTVAPSLTVEGKIVFSAGGSLYLVRAANGDVLAGPVPYMRQPDLRPDGQLIIANGEGGGKESLWTINTGGGLDAEQTSHPDDFHPYFNPANPGRFVFDSTRLPSGSVSLFVGDVGAKAADDGRQALNHGGGPIIGSRPIWLASDMLVYSGCDYGFGEGSNCGLYTVPSWGGVPQRIFAGGLTEFPSDGHGTQVLFTTQRDGNWEVYLINGDGAGLRNVSNSAGSQDGLGAFSPDGKQVAFVSDRGGTWAVWVAKVDGSGATRLFNLPAPLTGTWTDERISWAP